MSTPQAIAENEYAVIREIAREPVRTQRDLSRSAGLSLGMTNLILKRLTRKGLIKVRHLDWNRTQYLLTPKGALEKTRKTFDYALYTVRLFRQLQENMAAVLGSESGRDELWVVAQDELESVIREALAARAPAVKARFAASFAALPPRADLVLAATQEPAPQRPGLKVVSLVDFLDTGARLP